MEVAVVDKGGRGNVYAYSYAKSPRVSKVYVMPGNAGSALLSKCEQIPIQSIEEIIEFVEENNLDLTDVGMEGYLSDGIVDKFLARGLEIVGPIQKATILEASKCRTKDYLKQIGVPIPSHKNFDDVDKAKDFVRDFYRQHPEENVVVKADGLAAGKGSLVCNSLEEALDSIDKIMVQKIFDDAGNMVDIEKRLYGWELMFFVLTDGETVLPLEAAMDYKPAFDKGDRRIRYFGGRNPNTGGMGGYSPHPWLDDELRKKIMDRIVTPTITNLHRYEDANLKEGDYKGVLYFGLMICQEDDERNPYVEEINVRGGDPEAEIIYPRLKTPLYDISRVMLNGKLDQITLEWDPRYYVGIVAVSGPIVRSVQEERRGLKNLPGYPGEHMTNQPIQGLREVDSCCLIFHNGTAFKDPSKGDRDNNIHTTGGRVLTLVAPGNTLQEARDKAYGEIRKIWFRGIRYRRDTGSDK
ncbi:MAG: phosphoribosylamine--glycine ligase [Nitrososphaeria archaeon]|nr:phosphoribosylamine--glycine ligase [Nitrososphaeria archaeon]NIQ33218.1 phosphoribosylamine--glycine ligase [Nitrososphaeria archaeon]